MRVLAWPRSPSMIMSWPASQGVLDLGDHRVVGSRARRRTAARTSGSGPPRCGAAPGAPALKSTREARSSPRVVGRDPDIAGTLAAPGPEQEGGRPQPTTTPDPDQERGRQIRRQTPPPTKNGTFEGARSPRPRPRTGPPGTVIGWTWAVRGGSPRPPRDGGARSTSSTTTTRAGPQRKCPAIGLRPGREAGTRRGPRGRGIGAVPASLRGATGGGRHLRDRRGQRPALVG